MINTKRARAAIARIAWRESGKKSRAIRKKAYLFKCTTLARVECSQSIIHKRNRTNDGWRGTRARHVRRGDVRPTFVGSGVSIYISLVHVRGRTQCTRLLLATCEGSATKL